jgi:hypothetical protein
MAYNLLGASVSPSHFSLASSDVFRPKKNFRLVPIPSLALQKDFRFVPIPPLALQKDFRLVPIPSLYSKKHFRLHPYSWDENFTLIFVPVPYIPYIVKLSASNACL